MSETNTPPEPGAPGEAGFPPPATSSPTNSLPPRRARKRSPWWIVLWVLLGLLGVGLILVIGAVLIIGSIFKSVVVDSYASGEAARVSLQELAVSSAPEGWWSASTTSSACSTINLDCVSLAGEVVLVPTAELNEGTGQLQACTAIVDYALATGTGLVLPPSLNVASGDSSREEAIAECAKRAGDSSPVTMTGLLTTSALEKAASENASVFPPELPASYVLSQTGAGSWTITLIWG